MRLVLHREASSVLADAFELWCNAYERSILLQDFYGKEASLFTVTKGSEEEKEKSKKGLKGLLEGIDGERRKRILSSVKENLTTMCALLRLILFSGCPHADHTIALTIRTKVPSLMPLYTEYFGSICPL